MGTSPIASPAITGFSLVLDATTTFSTSTQVVGKIYAASYTAPTPAILTTAIGDMQTAYNAAAARIPSDFNEFLTGSIGGTTLAPGVYKWSSSVKVLTDVTLSGSSTDVWIFQIAGGITVASGKKVLLQGGAQAKNIFWQSAGKVTIGTNAHFEGNILGKTAISMLTGASLNGRALAQTAVTLDHNTVVRPA